MIENCEERLTRYSTVPSATKSLKFSYRNIRNFSNHRVGRLTLVYVIVYILFFYVSGYTKVLVFYAELNKNWKPVRNDSMRV